jgi:crossover junction endodeoxyribonuclease RuvC
MRILGIDPGTAIIGWGVIETAGNHPKPIAYGHITTPAGTELPDRLVTIAEELDRIIGEHAPDEAAVEDLFFSNNAKTAMSVGQARGAIVLTIRKRLIPVAGYTPNQVKQSLTSYGNADKRQMQLMVKSILHLPDIPKPDDTADALAVAVCHAFSRKTNALLK